MCDQDHEEQLRAWEKEHKVTRKQFGAILGAAGIAMMLPKAADAVTVTESEVNIKTPDGTCDAYFVHPATGTAPGVVVWPDIFGLRPALRQMGKRLAEAGYSVLVVNPFYRQRKGSATAVATAMNMQEMFPLMQALNETTHMTDAKAFTAWLDTQASVAKNKKMGTQGYCMGGPMALRTAAASDRVGAVASFHGAALVAKGDNSPHLQASKTKAQFLIAIAESDDKTAPTDKTTIKDTFGKAGVAAEVEVYPAMHGWCPPDTSAYNMEQAEKAWARLLVLYKKALA